MGDVGKLKLRKHAKKRHRRELARALERGGHHRAEKAESEKRTKP